MRKVVIQMSWSLEWWMYPVLAIMVMGAGSAIWLVYAIAHDIIEKLIKLKRTMRKNETQKGRRERNPYCVACPLLQQP